MVKKLSKENKLKRVQNLAKMEYTPPANVKTEGTKYDRARAILGTDKVFDGEKTYEITNQSGQVLGTVSYDAKEAIEKNKLDSYKPKNDEEKRVIDSLMQEAYKNSPYGKLEEGLKATKEIESTGKGNAYLKDSGVMGYQVKKSGNKYVVAPRTVSGFEGAFDYMKSNTLESFDKKEDAEKYVTKLEKANDFKIGSRYESTAKENVNDVRPNAAGFYDDSGFEDIKYDYINKNKTAISRQQLLDVQSGSMALGLDESFLKEMTDDEISVFNYLYKNMGKEKAYEYLKNIQGTLTGRQRNALEKQFRDEAKENPISSSLFTILTSPAKGLSYMGQVADYLDDGKIDQNAGYNKFSYTSSAIRDEVSKKVEKNWGKAGSWGYQLGMSMGDMLMNSAMGAGNEAFTLALMGAGAAADGVISAKDRGLSDNQAFALGTINGAVEVVTEKIGYDKLFKTDILEKGIKKYIFGNIASNAAEEGTAALANTITDIFISKDKSEWSQDVAAYMKEGDSKAKAIGKAVGKQALNIGLDALGGALMGGTISGVNAGTTYIAANNSYTTSNTDIRNIINTGLGLDKNSDAYKNAVKLQEKQDLYETGYAKKGVSDYEVVTQEWKNYEEETKAQGREVSEVREEVIKTGLESPKESEAYKNAKALSKQKNVSDYDLGKQYLLNVEQVSQETTEVKTRFAPGGATENIINLEKSMTREGVAEKDIEKIVSDAVTLESSLAKTPTTNMTAEMVERANGTITTQAKNNLAMNGAKNADYWGIYGTNLDVLSKSDKTIDEGFIDTYADAYAEGLKEGNSISYHSLAENTDNVAKALKNYVLTGAVPESMRGTNIVEKAGENLKGIIQSAVGSVSTAHKIVYGEGTNIARQAEAIKSGDFSSVISGESNNYKTTPSFNNAINTDEIRMVMNSTFKEGAMENIAEIMSATTGGVDMGVFAYKLAEYYQKNGNIGPFRKYFTDGGIAVTKTFENMAKTNQAVTVKEKTAPPETSILDMEEVENETTTEETTKEAENETGEVEKSAEGKKEKAKTESEKDKEIKESFPEKEEEKAKDNSGKALKRLGRKGKAAYQKVLEIEQSMHSEMSEYEVLREFEKSYRAGREGVKNTDGSRLTEQSRKVAEKAGKDDRKNKSTAKANVSKKSEEKVWQTKNTTEKAVEKESVSETKEPKSEKSSDSRDNIEVQGKGTVKWSSLHPRQQKAIVFMEGFAKAANMKLVFVANSPNFDGAYDISGDTMYLDIYAGVDPTNKLSDIIIPTASHELTHWMHYQAPVLWNKLSGAVFSTLEEVDGINRADRINSEIERLKGKGLVHNELVAEDEIVARACEDMLAQSEMGKKVFETLSETEQKTITSKIKDILTNLKNWISDFLSSYKPSNRIEAKKIRQAQDKVNEILKLWNEGIAKTVEVSKAETKAEAFIGNDVYEQYGVQFDVDQNADGMLLSEKDNKITVDDVKNIQSIGRKSVNDFTSEDISKTEKFARKYFEEMGVKSPFFRAWFGDWRVNDKTPVHIVTEKGAERGTTKNKDTNWDIQISGKVFNETKGHKAPNNTNAISYLDYINSVVENAILLDSYTIEDGKAKSENSAMMHSMYAVADIGNGLELIKLYVEELNDVNSNGTIKRSYQLQNLNKIPLESKRFSDNSLASSDQRYGYSVSDLYAFVKSVDKNFNPKSVSKVVNEDGTPKVVYHGTSSENGEFYIFDYNQAKKKVGHGFKQYGKGNYFSANKPKENSIFNGRIIESYLSIKNPYYSDGQLRESLKKSFGWNTDNMSYDEIQNKMRQMGYDGVVSNKGYIGQVFVSFDSTQIKSATDNIGTFDKNNPDIRYSEKDKPNESIETFSKTYSLSQEAETEVEHVILDKNYDKEVKLTNSSPTILTSQKGVKDLPMMMNASHIRENILTEDEAKKLGLSIGSAKHYHGLGKKLFLDVISGLDNVTEAYRGTKNAEKSERRENYFLLISQYKDAEGNTINVPVYVNEHGMYNRVFVDTNKIATVFGRKEFDKYIQKQIESGNLVKIKNRSFQASESTPPIGGDYSKNTSKDIILNSEKNVKENFLISEKKTVKNTVTKTPEQIYRMQNRDLIQFIRDEYDKSEKFMPRIEDVKKSANKLGKGYTGEKNLAYEFGKLYKEVKAAIAYGERTDATEQEIKRKWDEVQSKIDDIAMDIVMNNEVKNDENWQMIKDFRKYLHGRTIKVPAEWHADFDAQGGIDGFRKHNRGRFFVSYTKGESIETLYPEMRGMFGNLLPDISNPADQLSAISDFLDEMAVTFENPYDSDIEAAAESMSLEIMADMLVNIREVGDDVRSKRIEKLHRVLQEERLKRYHALNRVKERQERKIREATEKRKASAEKKADMAARQRLLAVAKKLESLAKKSDAEKQAGIQKLIGHLDLAAVGITGQKLGELNMIKEFYDKMKLNPDFIPDKRIEEKLLRLDKQRIADMKLEDVIELTNLLIAIEHKIRTDAFAIDIEDKRNLRIQAEETLRNIENSSGSKASGIGHSVDTIITNTLTPTRELRRMTGYVDDDPLYLRTKELQSGQVDKFDYAMKAEKMFEKYTNDKKFMESITGAKAKTYTYTIKEKNKEGKVLGDRTITITAGMRISLLLHNQNSDNQKHMKEGGVKLPDIELYKAGEIEEAYARGEKIYLHKTDIEEITKNITEEEREYARQVWRYFNNFSKNEINRVSVKLKGYELAKVKDYYPIEVSEDFMEQNFELVQKDGTIEGIGNLKERTGSNEPIYLRDVASVLDQGIRMHSSYVGLAIPVRNMTVLMSKNFSKYGEASEEQRLVFGKDYTLLEGYYSSIMETIGKKWGVNGQDYIEKMMQDIQGGKEEKRQNDITKKIKWVTNRFIKATLNWNLKVAFNQVASIPAAIPEVGFKAVARSLFDFGRVNTDLIAEYTPLQYMRGKGATNVTIADMTKSNNSVTSKIDNVIDKVDLMTWTDNLMTRKLWKAAIYNIKYTRKDLKTGTREFYEAVADVYTDIMQNTQPNVSMMERPQFLRADETTKMVMTFQGEPLKNVNLLYESAGNLRAKARQLKQIQNNKNSTKEEIEKAENRLKQAKSQFGVTVISQILSSLVFAVEKSIFQLLYGKVDDYWDDEEEKVTFCSWLVGTLKDTGINFFTQIPFAAHIVDFVSAMIFKDEQYYPYTPLAFSSLEDLESEVLSFKSSATDLFTGKGISGKEFGFAAYEVIEKASNFLGIPTKNVVNFAKSMIKLVEKNVSSNKYVGDYAVLKYEEALTRKKLIDGEVEIKATNSAYDILYRAMRDGDKEGYDIIFKDLVDRGVSYTDIESAMQSRAKKDENFKLDTSLNMYAGVEERGETEKYEKYIDSAEELGIDEELLKKVVDAANSKKKYKERKTDAEKIINGASLDFESEEFLKNIIADSYSVNDLSKEQYIEYSKTRATYLQKVDNEIDSEGMSEREFRKVYNKASDLAEEYALSEASDGEYSMRAKWMYYAVDAEEEVGMTTGEFLKVYEEYGSTIYSTPSLITHEVGYDVSDYLEFHKLTKDIKGDKDENGKDIEGRTKQDKIIEVISGMNVSDEMKAFLFSTEYKSEKNNPWEDSLRINYKVYVEEE